jgi:hypothetical protein
MVLLPPAPDLATNAVVHTPRVRTDAGKGDRPAHSGPPVSYPAIVTMRAGAVGDPLRLRGPGDQSVTFWDVLLFAPADPTVSPEDWLVDDHGRRLVADARSTYREPGAWLVVAKEVR